MEIQGSGVDRGATSIIESYEMTPPGSFFKRFPLTIKMVLITILIGLSVGYIANQMARNTVKEHLQSHVLEMLEQQSLENRIRFDNYLNNFRQTANLFTSNKKLLNHLDTLNSESGQEGYHQYSYYPEWFPSKSILRSLTSPRFVMIYSHEMKLREYYYASYEERIPDFISLDSFTLEKSIGTTHITTFDNFPFILTAKQLTTVFGSKLTLVLASPLDELFFLHVRAEFPQQFTGLLTPDKKRILSSSKKLELPPGSLLKDIQKTYLVHFHEFHEYGGSEFQIHFASFTPLNTVDLLTEDLMDTFTTASVILTLSILTAFSLFIYAFSLRIEKITTHIREYTVATKSETEPTLTDKFQLDHGDEIALLENSFSQLTTEIDRKTNQLQTANEKLKESYNHLVETREELLKTEKLAIVGQMSGIVAHELLNPITSIAIRIEKNIGYGQQTRKVTEKMCDTVKQITSLALQITDNENLNTFRRELNTITDYATALDKNQELRLEDLTFLENELNKVIMIVDGFRQMARKERILEQVNFVDVVKDILDEQEDLLEKNKINLSVNVDPIPLILGDYMEFHTVFANLIINAIDAIRSKKDDDKKLISIRVRPGENTTLEILVADTGVGIAPEDIEKIFEHDFTTKGRDGTGFGLAVSRKIARSYNGDLVVAKSTPGTGTTFQLLLEVDAKSKTMQEDTA